MINDFLVLTSKGSRMVHQLRVAAIENDVICMQAPILWDGETKDDIIEAKRGCNGFEATKEAKGYPPCPLRAMCLETAIEIDAQYGVWGGLTRSERWHLSQRPITRP